ncbi:MAG: 1-acyl-sn-glycerol-3-phosphate acyltransferase [Bacteroidales bacterium]|nr:1-acyl-sn-glycerol-3-phosphate acyltransferase [Bacteroidales bacterium]
MSRIWEKNSAYSILRFYVDGCTRASYRRLTFSGDLPDDGAVIIAPNHTSTLMDALVVLCRRHGATVFGARADIFRKPLIAKILRFLRIVPMARIRDGAESVLKNRETFAEVDDVLANGIPFCIFAEGRHRPMHSLLPIGKGIARIAFASAAERKTYVVPTGIDHGSFFRFRRPCKVTFGEPVDVNAFLQAHEHDPETETYKEFRRVLFRRISSLITYVPDDEDYASRWEAIRPKRESHIWLAVLTAPLFFLAALLCLPMWVTAEVLCRRAKDHAWNNTIRFGVKLLGTPLMLLFWLLVLPGWWKLGAILFLLSYSFFYDWLNLVPSPGIGEE